MNKWINAVGTVNPPHPPSHALAQQLVELSIGMKDSARAKAPQTPAPSSGYCPGGKGNGETVIGQGTNITPLGPLELTVNKTVIPFLFESCVHDSGILGAPNFKHSPSVSSMLNC